MSRLSSILVLALLVVAMAACGKSEHTQQLESIETFVADKPDSALTLLKTIDPASLSESDRALHALLTTQAIDKSGADQTNDSLIRIAVDYYKDTGEHHRLAVAYFYLGQIQYHRGEYDASIPNLLAAADEAAHTDDYIQQALIYRTMSDLFRDTYCGQQAIKYAQLALQTFKKAGTKGEKYIPWAEIDLSSSYIANCDYDKASEKLNSIIQSAKTSNTLAYLSALRTAYIIAMRSGNYTKALDALDEIKIVVPVENLTANDLRTLSAANYAIGNIDSAAYYEELFNRTGSDLSTLKYHKFKALGDYKSAFDDLWKEVQNQNELIAELSRSNTISEINTYNSARAAKREHDYKLRYVTVILSAILIALVTIFIIIWQRKRILAKKRQIEEYITEIGELQHDIHIMESKTNSDINSKTVETKQISDLYINQFSVIKNLCYDYYSHSDEKIERDIIFNKVEATIKKFNDDLLKSQKIECEINANLDNIISKLRNDFPEFDKFQINIFIFSILNFPINTIAMMLGKTSNQIRYAKKQMKDSITNNPSPNSDTYLNYL